MRKDSSLTFRGALQFIALTALVTLPSTLLQAQSTDVRSETVFEESIAVRLITLPVIARSSSGRAVSDLTADEIEVIDGDVRREVAFISPFFQGVEERENLPNVRLVTALPNGDREISRATVKEPRHLLLIFDLENGPPVGLKDTVEHVIEFLRQDIDESFRVGIMSFDGELNLLHPFSQNRDSIETTLRGIYEERRARARSSTQTRIDQFLRKLELCEIQEPDNQFDDQNPADRVGILNPEADVQCLADSMYEYAGQAIPKANAFLSTMERIVDYASGLEGHKFILTIGSSVGFNPAREAGEAMRAMFGPLPEIQRLEQSLQSTEHVRPRVEELMEEAFRSNVTLSFLDRSQAPSDFSARQRRILNPGFQPRLTAYQAAQEDIDELASSTGGTLIAETRIDNGLEESLAMMESGYYVSFYVDDDEELSASRINRIKVRSNRGGVSLRHRRAYEGAVQAPRGRVRGIIQVGSASPQTFEGIRGNFVPLKLVLDPRDLGYEEDIEGVFANFSVHFMIRNPEGTLLADNYHYIRHRYPRLLWKEGDVEPPAIMAWADLPNGDYFAEAIVTVPSNGNRGITKRHIAVRGSDPERDRLKTEAAETSAENESK